MKLDLDKQGSWQSNLVVSGIVELELSDGRPSDAQVDGDLTIDCVDRRFLLNGTVKAVGKTECVRCLEHFDLEWQVPVDLMIIRDSQDDEGEQESLVILQSSGEVDLSDSIRECVVLAFPHIALCADTCKGICVDCGVNRNQEECSCAEEDYDPRWEGLP